jgi:acyl carrier protein
MNESQVMALLEEFAAGVLKHDPPPFTASTRLAELGIDSVGLFEMVGDMEERLQLSLNDSDIAKLSTVGDVIALICRAVHERDG